MIFLNILAWVWIIGAVLGVLGEAYGHGDAHKHTFKRFVAVIFWPVSLVIIMFFGERGPGD